MKFKTQQQINVQSYFIDIVHLVISHNVKEILSDPWVLNFKQRWRERARKKRRLFVPSWHPLTHHRIVVIWKYFPVFFVLLWYARVRVYEHNVVRAIQTITSAHIKLTFSFRSFFFVKKYRCFLCRKWCAVCESHEPNSFIVYRPPVAILKICFLFNDIIPHVTQLYSILA